MKRKKRLEKGIKSIEEQIEFHKEKLKKAIQDGEEELAGYYTKEIESLENTKGKKEDLFDKL
ncbi:MAG: hypothetical protein ABH840_02225 [Nanoarchaeota archaeon]